jgi:uncharacterized protein
MTDPDTPQDPNASTEPPSGNSYPQPQSEQPAAYSYPPPQQQQPPHAQYGTPPASSGYQPQPPAGPAQTGPFSPMVGRPLTNDETLWSMLAHMGGIIIGFIAPLIVMLTKGNESPYTRYHSVEALNFQITMAIGWIVAGVLTLLFIGFLLYPVLLIANIAFCIIAGLAAQKGEPYRYPVALRLVK